MADRVDCVEEEDEEESDEEPLATSQDYRRPQLDPRSEGTVVTYKAKEFGKKYCILSARKCKVLLCFLESVTHNLSKTVTFFTHFFFPLCFARLCECRARWLFPGGLASTPLAPHMSAFTVVLYGIAPWAGWVTC